MTSTKAVLLFSALSASATALATDFEVGPGQAYTAIGDVPWESLGAGDRVLIQWRSDPYREKWVIGGQGTADQPIVVRGVPGPQGQRPVISGEDATTRQALDYWNEPRGVVKVGGSSAPADIVPTHIVIEGLEVRTARPGFFFTDDSGGRQEYVNNAAAVYVEKAAHLTVRDCVLHDTGNGLFIGVSDGETQDILIEGNHIYDNGIEGRIYEHNSYTSAIGITFQFNHYGPLRAGCLGNNLKDRSAGLVVRYNWIESGNRQLDLVDGEDSANVVSAASYRETFVYGNVLIEPEGAGNSQIVHYGGDSPDEIIYRKGILYFFNNTVVSTRSDNTTLLRLSTNEEHADVRNNVVYTTAAPGTLAMLSSNGVLDLSHNWFSTGWTDSHSSFNGTINEDGSTLTGTDPGFEDVGAQDFALADGSGCVNAGAALHADVLPDNDVVWHYVRHQAGVPRPVDAPLDLGAFERCTAGACSAADAGPGDSSAPDTSTPDVVVIDSNAPDAASPDSVLSDSASSDSASLDTSMADANAADASAQDSAQPDTSRSDVGLLDATALRLDAGGGEPEPAVGEGCACAGASGVGAGAVVAWSTGLVLVYRRRDRRRGRERARRGSGYIS